MKKGDLVTFKTIQGNWFTGKIQWYSDDNHYSVEVRLPVYPQWLENGDQTIYYPDEIQEIIVLK